VASLLLLLLLCHGSHQQCCPERVVAGASDKSGSYSLASSSEGRCPDGCLYNKQGSSTSYCFASNPEFIASCSSGNTVGLAPSPAVNLTPPPNITVALGTEPTATTTTTLPTTTTTSVAQVWMMNRTRFTPPTISDKGTWGEDEFCEVGAYAIGYQLYVADVCVKRCNNDDDKALMGVRLFCAMYPHTTESAAATTSITSMIAEPCGRRSNLPCSWKSTQSCASPAFLTESRYLSEYFHDVTVTAAGAEFESSCEPGVVCRDITTSSSDPVGGMNVDMRCSDGTSLTGDGVQQSDLPLVGGVQTSSWSTWTTCPPNYAICGIKTKIHMGELDKISNLGQTELMFHCCQLPASFTG